MLLILGLSIVAFILFLWVYANYPYRSLAHIPGPKAAPFFGNLRDFKDKLYYHVHAGYARTYGSVSKHYMGRIGVVVVSDVKLIKEFALSNFDTFHNRPLDSTRRVRKTTSLIFARDDYWRRLRRTMSPTFNATQMKSMIPHINDQMGVFLSKLADASSTSKSVNIHALIARLTLDVIGSVAFGAQLHVQDDQESELVRAATAVIQNSPSVRGYDGWTKLLVTMFPFLSPIFRAFPPEGDKELLRNALLLDSYSDTMLKKRRELRLKEAEEIGKRRKDFLDLLIEARDPETGDPMTDREILDQSNLFLLAGHETTANTIAYTIFLLAQHPEIDEELGKECKELTEVSYQSLREMKLMNMVLKESLRLYPPAVVIRREADKDTNLGGYHIPKGTWVMAPVWGMHYDETYWEDPTAFKPIERWADKSKTEHQFHWLPFGAGPHGCIGERFAMMEAALILSQILKNFRFTLEPGQLPLQLQAGITVVPKNGIHVRVHPRDSK